MKALIVGGGKVGYFLTKTLISNQTKVTLVEKDSQRAQKISEELNIDVICGDGSDIAVLEDAHIHQVDLIAAVTGNDEENLVICQIAKAVYPRHKTIARINNPKNIGMFRQLGVDKTVCSTKVIADLIDYEISSTNVKIVQTFERGNMVLAEVFVDDELSWANKKVKDIEIPKDLILISIIRGDESIYPKGDTLINPQDHVMVVSSPEIIQDLKKSL